MSAAENSFSNMAGIFPLPPLLFYLSILFPMLCISLFSAHPGVEIGICCFASMEQQLHRTFAEETEISLPLQTEANKNQSTKPPAPEITEKTSEISAGNIAEKTSGKVTHQKPDREIAQPYPDRETCRKLLTKINRPLPVDQVSVAERNLVIFLFERAYPEQAEELDYFFVNCSVSSCSGTAARTADAFEVTAYVDTGCGGTENRKVNGTEETTELAYTTTGDVESEDQATEGTDEAAGSAPTQEDIRNIKYMVYCAAEPWRSVFLSQIGNFQLCPVSGRSCYIIEDKGIVCVDFSTARSDPRGPYTSFFHECGHGIGEVCFRKESSGNGEICFLKENNRNGKVCSQTENFIASETILRRAGGKSLKNALSAGSCISAEQLTAVLSNEYAAYLRSGATETAEAVTDMGSAFSVLNSAARDSQTTGSIAETEVARSTESCKQSDTENAGHVHEASYWNCTDLPAKEFFAEYFSYQMTGNEAALQVVESGPSPVFPEACGIVRGLLSKLEQEGRFSSVDFASGTISP